MSSFTLISLQSQHLQALPPTQLCVPKPDLELCDTHLHRGYSCLSDLITLAQPAVAEANMGCPSGEMPVPLSQGSFQHNYPPHKNTREKSSVA